MNFQPTSGQTSGEKIFRKIFYLLKRTSNFRGTLGVVWTFDFLKKFILLNVTYFAPFILANSQVVRFLIKLKVIICKQQQQQCNK